MWNGRAGSDYRTGRTPSSSPFLLPFGFPKSSKKAPVRLASVAVAVPVNLTGHEVGVGWPDPHLFSWFFFLIFSYPPLLSPTNPPLSSFPVFSYSWFRFKKKQNSNQCSVISPGSKKVSNNWGKGEDEEKEDGREEARGKARERKEGRRRPKRTKKKKTRLLAAVLADVERRTVECETTETLVDDVHTRTHFRQMTATESSASFSIILFFSSSKKKIPSYCLRCPGNGIAVGMFRIAKPKQMCSRYLVTSRKKLMKLFLKKIGHIVHLDHWTPWKIHRQPICRVFYLKTNKQKVLILLARPLNTMTH